MRLIKLGLLSACFLFVVMTVISLFIPSHVRISKATNLPASADTVLRFVRDTAQWKTWHPWFQQSQGLSGQIGVSWTERADTRSTVVLSQAGKKTLINSWQVHSYPGADSLTLQWYMDFYPAWYPWEKFGTLFYEQTYGVMMERGLGNLKDRFAP